MPFARRMANLEVVWVILRNFRDHYLQRILLVQQLIRTCTVLLFISLVHDLVRVAYCNEQETTTMHKLHRNIPHTLEVLTICSRIFVGSNVHRNKYH